MLNPFVIWGVIVVAGFAIEPTFYTVGLGSASIAVVLMTYGIFDAKRRASVGTQGQKKQQWLPGKKSGMQRSLASREILGWLNLGPRTYGELVRAMKVSGSGARGRTITTIIEQLAVEGLVEPAGEIGKLQLTARGRRIAEDVGI